MKRAKLSIGAIASQQNPSSDVSVGSLEKRRVQTIASVAGPTPRLTNMGWPRHPVRLTLASRLGNKIDGAWWPRTGLMSRELTELVSVLDVRLGQVVDINVNWSALQRQPDLNWDGWQGIRPHVMTVCGRDSRANLLVVPQRTGTALAVMVLRRAAGLPVYPAHRDSRAFLTAECILRLARGEQMFEVRRSRREAVEAIQQGRKD